MAITKRAYGYFGIILSHLAYSKKRTFLTLVGLMIGISALVSLLSVGIGLQGIVQRQFEQFGTDKFIVSPGGGIGPSSSTAVTVLTRADLNAIKKARGVRTATPIIAKVSTVDFGSLSAQVMVLGIETERAAREVFVDTASFSVDRGRIFNEKERGVVLVGWGYANGKYVFEEKNVSVGQRLVIGGRSFRVIGVITRQGNPIDDSHIYISLDDAEELFNTTGFFEIVALADAGYPVDLAAENAKKKLIASRNVVRGEEDFTIQTPGQLLETFNSILGVVGWVVLGIAVISLVVGGVGIMNTMYTSVLERTTEIGIMKAVGASSYDILAIFVIESGALGLAGGALGVGIGMALAKAVEFGSAYAGISGFYAVYDGPLIAGAMAVAFIVGTVSGVFPARRAARMRPADAIRGE